jgi:S-adenosylhomocysteine hydrolase
VKDKHSGPATTITELRGTAEQGRLVMAEVLDRLDGVFPAAVGRHRLGPGTYLVPLGGGSTLLIALAPAATPRDRCSGQLVLSATLLDRTGLGDADVARALGCVEAVPFTGWECDAFTEQLPLLAGLPRRLADKPLGECGLLVVGHLLSDLVVQIRTLIALGARPEAMTVLDKGYPHKLRRRVDAHLAGLGIAVLPVAEVETAVRLHAARVMEPSVVVDDGGHVLPALLTLAPELVPEYRGVVEQSPAGMEQLEALEAVGALEALGGVVPLPVFSVAQSKAKRGIEAHWIAESVVRSIRELLPGEAFDGAAALVIGYGTIGEQVAAVLRAQRMRVAVYDSQWPRLLAAHEAGYLTSPEVPALLDGHRPLLIVSSSGRTGLGGEDLDFLAGDCFVASVSGRVMEIDRPGLAARAEHIEDLGRVGVRYLLPRGPVTVLADGLPVHLPRGDTGSVAPARHSDLTMAAVAWGACTLARPDHGFALGPDLERTDASIAESGLVERYYRLYGPGAGAKDRGRSRSRSAGEESRDGAGGVGRRIRGRARISEV